MPDYCVVFGCSNEASRAKGITLFKIPYLNDERPEAKRRRKLWINFVMRTRDKWRPTEKSSICCKHFTEDNFEWRFSSLPGMSGSFIPRLIRDEIGIISVPSVHPDSETSTQSRKKRKTDGESLSARSCRRVNSTAEP